MYKPDQPNKDEQDRWAQIRQQHGITRWIDLVHMYLPGTPDDEAHKILYGAGYPTQSIYSVETELRRLRRKILGKH